MLNKKKVERNMYKLSIEYRAEIIQIIVNQTKAFPSNSIHDSQQDKFVLNLMNMMILDVF